MDNEGYKLYFSRIVSEPAYPLPLSRLVPILEEEGGIFMLPVSIYLKCTVAAIISTQSQKTQDIIITPRVYPCARALELKKKIK